VEPGERSWPTGPNDPSGQYGPADDPGYQGFHTYATSDLYDTNGGDERWPDNWAAPREPYYDERYEHDERDRRYEPEEPEDDAEYERSVTRDYWMALVWTFAWYAVPLVILLLRALLLSGSPDAACTASGLASCSSRRAEALGSLISNAPMWCFALGAGITLAMVLRWASETWRAITIGFCAAVVSGGAITVLYRIW
jgi:hypothetical protein